MKPGDFVEKSHLRIARTAIGPSSFRGQKKEVLQRARGFLASRVNLSLVPVSSQAKYAGWLNRATIALLDAMGVKNRPWGLARKSLNLFMRDVLYNQYLSAHFGFDKLEPWLEVPLDSAVAKRLRVLAGARGKRVPVWPRLKGLEQPDNRTFQGFALDLAKGMGIERVHLDLYLWPQNKDKSKANGKGSFQ